jgi:hypothetical protein
MRTSTQDPKRRGQRAQKPQRSYPPLSALLTGIEHQRRAAPTQGKQVLSSGSLFYAEVVRRHVLSGCFSWHVPKSETEGRSRKSKRRRRPLTVIEKKLPCCCA